MKLTKYRLGDCIEMLKNGAVIQQRKGASGIPITRIETLSGNNFNRDKLGYADITDASDFVNYILDDKDILISHINSKEYIGRTVQYHRKGDEIILHGMNLLRCKTKSYILDQDFAYYFMQSPYFKKSIHANRKDAVNQSSIAISDIFKIEFDCPDLQTQKNIAQTLSLIDRKIELNREINRNLELTCHRL